MLRQAELALRPTTPQSLLVGGRGDSVTCRRLCIRAMAVVLAVILDAFAQPACRVCKVGILQAPCNLARARWVEAASTS